MGLRISANGSMVEWPGQEGHFRMTRHPVHIES
jgi:hypothetical protein